MNENAGIETARRDNAADALERFERDETQETALYFQDKAKDLVYRYTLMRLDKTDSVRFSVNDVYVVWFCKTLQNWKALLSTNLPDGMYYEVTRNGDKNEIYLDAYKKFDNITFPD